MHVYLGCYGTWIMRAEWSARTGALSVAELFAELPNPSWLAKHPTLDVIYAVSETSDGAVAAFRFDGVPLGTQPSHGGEPCHLAVDPSGQCLVVANYGGGSMAVYPLDEGGSIKPASKIESFGPNAHAHQVVFREDRIVVTDLGNDEIRQYTPDFSAVAITHLPEGCGPRHLVFTTDGYGFATAELSGSVLVLDADLSLMGTVALPPANAPSGLTLSPDGAFLYVANRGPDSISVFAVDGPRLNPVTEVPCGGEWPRDIMFLGDVLCVANQRSDTVAAFRLEDGIPRAAGVFPSTSPTSLIAGSS